MQLLYAKSLKEAVAVWLVEFSHAAVICQVFERGCNCLVGGVLPCNCYMPSL